MVGSTFEGKDFFLFNQCEAISMARALGFESEDVAEKRSWLDNNSIPRNRSEAFLF